MRLRKVPLTRWIQLALAIGAGVWIWLLRDENADLKRQLAAISTTTANSAPAPLETIHGYHVMHTSQAWIIGWEAVIGADNYAVSVMTEKMDSLLVRESLPTARCMIPADQLPQIPPDGSFLYKIDAYRRGDLVASSGYVAYPPI
jgi:hypothetical protein